MSEWMDISSAPRDGTSILVYEPGNRQGDGHINISLVYWAAHGYGDKTGGWVLCECGHHAEDDSPTNDRPTHWKPLDTAPDLCV